MFAEHIFSSIQTFQQQGKTGTYSVINRRATSRRTPIIGRSTWRGAAIIRTRSASGWRRRRSSRRAVVHTSVRASASASIIVGAAGRVAAGVGATRVGIRSTSALLHICASATDHIAVGGGVANRAHEVAGPVGHVRDVDATWCQRARRQAAFEGPWVHGAAQDRAAHVGPVAVHAALHRVRVAACGGDYFVVVGWTGQRRGEVGQQADGWGGSGQSSKHVSRIAPHVHAAIAAACFAGVPACRRHA